MHCRGPIQDWQKMPFPAEKPLSCECKEPLVYGCRECAAKQSQILSICLPGSNSGQRDPLVFQFATAVKICTKSYQQFSSLFNSREHRIVLTSFVSALRRAGNLFFRSPLKSSHPS